MELKRATSCAFSAFFMVLIVPYGIETEDVFPELCLRRGFNRTLWN